MQELLLDLSLVGLVLVAAQQSADRQGNLLLLLVDSGDLGIHHLALGQNITGLLNAAVGSSDVVMLNYVGQASISAVSLAANYANILANVFYGLGTGATLLCAQYYGKRDFRAIQAVQGIALQAFWLAMLLLVRHRWMGRQLQRVIVQGG